LRRRPARSRRPRANARTRRRPADAARDQLLEAAARR
jgi:hypothetical protein